MFLALLGRRTHRRGLFRQITTDLAFQKFPQRNVRQAHGPDIVDQWTPHAAATGVQLAHAARYQVHQHIRVANFFNGLFAKFSVHYYLENERDIL